MVSSSASMLASRLAEVTVEPDMGLVDALYRQTQMASSTTPAGCH